MQFVFPGFLAALQAVIAIPVIIHLFYFRRFERVCCSNVRFLKEVKEETSNRDRNCATCWYCSCGHWR
jgi:Na+/H+ antiporter NhaD/arsenite permease-like protein